VTSTPFFLLDFKNHFIYFMAIVPVGILIDVVFKVLNQVVGSPHLGIICNYTFL